MAEDGESKSEMDCESKNEVDRIESAESLKKNSSITLRKDGERNPRFHRRLLNYARCKPPKYLERTAKCGQHAKFSHDPACLPHGKSMLCLVQPFQEYDIFAEVVDGRERIFIPEVIEYESLQESPFPLGECRACE